VRGGASVLAYLPPAVELAAAGNRSAVGDATIRGLR